MAAELRLTVGLDFASRVIAWQQAKGRHQLPWQQTRDAYRIWLSEIMLQQTQVQTVIPYYDRFLARFPTLQALAEAPVESVPRNLGRTRLLRAGTQSAPLRANRRRRPCRQVLL
jgi:adenine-specific DNA glycosylase